mgnify:CR=1 FL=1
MRSPFTLAIVVLAAIAGMTVMVVSFAFNTPRQSTDTGYGDITTAEEIVALRERGQDPATFIRENAELAAVIERIATMN